MSTNLHVAAARRRCSRAPACAAAADLQAGAAKAQVCQACHGLDGNSTVPDYPKLGGQRPDYLAKALRDYKSGARKNAIMGAIRSAADDAGHRQSRCVLRGPAARCWW